MLGGIILFLIILFGLGCALWIFNDLLNEYFNFIRRKVFKKDFEDCLKHSQPTWDDVKEIASISAVTHQSILKVLQHLHVQVLAGRNAELEQHKNLLQSYINSYKIEEPFEGIPNEIRMHLERLRENIGGSEHLLDPLTSQIRELLSVKQKEMRQQKWYTIGGFAIGLAGLIFAIFTYYIQLPAKSIDRASGMTLPMSNITTSSTIKK